MRRKRPSGGVAAERPAGGVETERPPRGVETERPTHGVERREVEIVAVDDEGAGVAAPGRAPSPLRVPFALPGDRVACALEHVSPHGRGAWARLDRIVRPSTERVATACAAFGRCGGCALQAWAYPKQVAWKRERLARALGGVSPDLPVADCVASPRALGYRAKSKLVFGRASDGRVLLGAYAPRTHDLVDLAGCAIAEPPLDEVARALAEAATASGLPIFDERTGAGLLRHALLRASHRGEVLVTLVVAGDASPALVALAERLRSAQPSVLGVVAHRNTSRGNALLADEAPDVTLAGASLLDERIGNAHLRLGPRSFLQVNRGTAARLYGDLAAALRLDGGERVLDVYCGVGGIALTLAPSLPRGEVLGVESVAGAVEDARAAAASAGIANARFVAGDAATLLDEAGRADVVVLNPPRRGVAPAVVRACLRLAPRTIAYVSCDPSTLARDLAALVAGRYRLRSATPYDMLPHTPHVEALAILDRVDFA